MYDDPLIEIVARLRRARYRTWMLWALCCLFLVFSGPGWPRVVALVLAFFYTFVLVWSRYILTMGEELLELEQHRY